MKLSKRELVQQYRAKVKDPKAEFEATGNQAENHRANQYGLFLLAQKYLRDYPELFDHDCSDRGLLGNSYAWIHYLYSFAMDSNIENQLKQRGFFELFCKKHSGISELNGTVLITVS